MTKILKKYKLIIRLTLITWATGILGIYLYYIGLTQGGLDKALRLIGIN